MAVERVARVLVAVHQDQGESFLRALQQQGILHITATEETEPARAAAELERESGRLDEAIAVLGPRSGKKSGLLGESKVQMSRREFEERARDQSVEERLERTRELNRRLEEIANRERQVAAEAARLLPWRGLEHAPAGLYGSSRVEVTLGRFADSSELDRARNELAGLEAAVEPAGESEAGVAAVVVAARDRASDVGRVLAGMRFETDDLRALDRRPADALAALAEEKTKLAAERETIETDLAVLAQEIAGLKARADALANERARVETEARLERTATVLLIHGWVKEREYDELKRLVERAETAVLVRVAPGEDESQPVALHNPKPFRPFELVLDLYSMPTPRELDPTVLLAPFFALFFGFCLTDAGYGIVLVVLAALLMRKMGASNKLLGMLFIGGFFTIIAGVLVGSWFGDLPAKLGIPALVSFRDSLMWFDPLENPMPFFILSIAMGYLHMMYGMVIEVADCLRRREVGEALLGQFPWFVALNSLVVLVLAGKSLPGWVSPVLLLLVLASVAAILVFTQRDREIALPQTAWFLLFWLTLVFFAAKLGGLPPVFGIARWALLAVFGGLFVVTFVDLRRSGRLGPVPLVLGGLGVAALGLYLGGVLPWPVPALAGLAFFFSAPANRRVAGKLAWGGYALYGATSYVGVVLSYIRIMALGMVTGGIAMAINTVAFMVTGIPVLGVVIAIIVLVGGHAYNIAVNVLGAFVHTLRLNYVEFFPRFYTGGGEPFVPFKEENRYVAVR